MSSVFSLWMTLALAVVWLPQETEQKNSCYPMKVGEQGTGGGSKLNLIGSRDEVKIWHISVLKSDAFGFYAVSIPKVDVVSNRKLGFQFSRWVPLEIWPSFGLNCLNFSITGQKLGKPYLHLVYKKTRGCVYKKMILNFIYTRKKRV